MLTAGFSKEFSKIVETVREGKESNFYGFEPKFQGPQGGRSRVNGSEVIMLTSNNYLGLANHPEVKKSMKEALDKFGSGTCGARLHNGTTVLHQELEEKLADWLGSESALVFSSGFMTNLGTISALGDAETVIITDQLNHMSIVDGYKLAEGKVKIFSHNDMGKLEYTLERTPEATKKLIVVEGVYSMDGDIAPLEEIQDLARKYSALVMVDDAHSLGVLGTTGRGTTEHFGVGADIVMGTFSKSLAGVGGFIAAPDEVVEYVRHTSHAYIFNASLPPVTVAGVLKSLELLQREPWRREKLWRNTIRFRAGLIEMGFDVMNSVTPIVPLFIGDDKRAMIMAKELMEAGVYIASAIFPAVPRGMSRYRATITAALEDADIDESLNTINRVAKRHGIIA
jgi:8-amino-7-oxononanoate synthase